MPSRTPTPFSSSINPHCIYNSTSLCIFPPHSTAALAIDLGARPSTTPSRAARVSTCDSAEAWRSADTREAAGWSVLGVSAEFFFPFYTYHSFHPSPFATRSPRRLSPPCLAPSFLFHTVPFHTHTKSLPLYLVHPAPPSTSLIPLRHPRAPFAALHLLHLHKSQGQCDPSTHHSAASHASFVTLFTPSLFDGS